MNAPESPFLDYLPMPTGEYLFSDSESLGLLEQTEGHDRLGLEFCTPERNPHFVVHPSPFLPTYTMPHYEMMMEESKLKEEPYPDPFLFPHRDMSSGDQDTDRTVVPHHRSSPPLALRSSTLRQGTVRYNFQNQQRRHHTKKALTPHEKKNICLYAEKYPSMRQEDIANIFKVERSTVSKILKDSCMWLNAPNYPSNTKNYKMRRAKYPSLEDAMIPWLQQCRERNINISDNSIKEKAAAINHDLNAAGPDFRASGGWLENFKRRQGIKGGQYRGTHNVVLPNGQVYQEQTDPLIPQIEPTHKTAYQGYDLRLASTTHTPDVEFWEREHDDPGLDISMDSDNEQRVVDYPPPPSDMGTPNSSSSVAGRPRSHRSHSPSISPPQSYVDPPLPTLSPPAVPRASGSEPPHDIPCHSTESPPPPRVAPPPAVTPWMDQMAGEAYIRTNQYHSIGEKPNQAPMVLDHDQLQFLGSTVTAGQHASNADSISPFEHRGGLAPNKSPITTLEAKEQLANICMYLDAHGRSRKLCKRSQRVAIQEVLTNVMQYMHGRELAGLEPT